MSKGNAGAAFRIPRLLRLKKHLGFNDCVIPGCTDRVTIHHIVPREKGGKSNVENLMPICHRHHSLLHFGVVLHYPRVEEHKKVCFVEGCGAEGERKDKGQWRCGFHNWQNFQERMKVKYGDKWMPREYKQ